MKKILSVLCASVAALAITMPGAAQASYYGDVATITSHANFIFSPTGSSNSSVVGGGTEYTYTTTDVFDQVWTVNVDILQDQFKVSFNEATRGSEGNLSSGSNIFEIDISFTGSQISALSLGNYTTTSHYSEGSGLSSFGLSGTNSAHFAFHKMYAGDEYTFNAPAAAVPEPETYAMLLTGLGLVGFAARRKRAV
jgi:hypothetical protein